MDMQQLQICLWFDDQAEEAVRFYTSVFRNSSMGTVLRYSEAGKELHGKTPGSVMTVEFSLNGQEFLALNGGPIYRFTEAVSFVIRCADQEEIDFYWEKLSRGADEKAQNCGWLKDRFGISWQIVPQEYLDMLREADSEKSKRLMDALYRMKKPDIAILRSEY